MTTCTMCRKSPCSCFINRPKPKQQSIKEIEVEVKLIQMIKRISYLSSHHYVAWILSNILFFLPMAMMIMITKAVKIGLKEAADYLVENDFRINFSYQTYQHAKQVIARDYMKHCGSKP